ncbi:hypothetical protein DPSP01_005863 [Paraphaeosphaeria sporulosa]
MPLLNIRSGLNGTAVCGGAGKEAQEMGHAKSYKCSEIPDTTKKWESLPHATLARFRARGEKHVRDIADLKASVNDLDDQLANAYTLGLTCLNELTETLERVNKKLDAAYAEVQVYYMSIMTLRTGRDLLQGYSSEEMLPAFFPAPLNAGADTDEIVETMCRDEPVCLIVIPELGFNVIVVSTEQVLVYHGHS